MRARAFVHTRPPSVAEWRRTRKWSKLASNLVVADRTEKPCQNSSECGWAGSVFGGKSTFFVLTADSQDAERHKHGEGDGPRSGWVSHSGPEGKLKSHLAIAHIVDRRWRHQHAASELTLTCIVCLFSTKYEYVPCVYCASNTSFFILPQESKFKETGVITPEEVGSTSLCLSACLHIWRLQTNGFLTSVFLCGSLLQPATTWFTTAPHGNGELRNSWLGLWVGTTFLTLFHFVLCPY